MLAVRAWGILKRSCFYMHRMPRGPDVELRRVFMLSRLAVSYAITYSFCHAIVNADLVPVGAL
jgi:hypothetical protein